MVAVKVAAFYRFRPAAARSGRRAVHRSGSRWQEPVLRRRPREWPPANVVEHGRWAILGAPAARLSALSSRQRENTATSAAQMRALRERERRGLRRFTIGVSEDDRRVIAMSAGALTLELCAVFGFAGAIEPMHSNPAKMLRQARSDDGFPATLAVRHEDQAALKVDVLPAQMQDALSFHSLLVRPFFGRLLCARPSPTPKAAIGR